MPTGGGRVARRRRSGDGVAVALERDPAAPETERVEMDRDHGPARDEGASHEELCGLLAAMLDAAEPLPVDGPVIDTCGTGGSPQRRVAAFNVSTAAAIVAAQRTMTHGSTMNSGVSRKLNMGGRLLNAPLFVPVKRASVMMPMVF